MLLTRKVKANIFCRYCLILLSLTLIFHFSTVIVGCRTDGDCPSQTACINEKCIDPCTLDPCTENTECRVIDTVPVRTIACECLPGYQGDALDKCIPSKITFSFWIPRLEPQVTCLSANVSKLIAYRIFENFIFANNAFKYFSFFAYVWYDGLHALIYILICHIALQYYHIMWFWVLEISSVCSHLIKLALSSWLYIYMP